jgi:hypothetical protein
MDMCPEVQLHGETSLGEKEQCFLYIYIYLINICIYIYVHICK